MKRRLSNILAVLSLVLCVATAVLFARSFVRGDVIRYFCRTPIDPSRDVEIGFYYSSGNGGISFAYGKYALLHRYPTDAAAERARYAFVYEGQFRLERLHTQHIYGGLVRSSRQLVHFGFAFRSLNAVAGDYGWAFTVPWALPLLLTMILPSIAVGRWRRKRRRFAQGFCPTCGYDLRATPQRCPECGTVPATEVKASN